jgi:uncharacterized protein (DUF1330 family)
MKTTYAIALAILAGVGGAATVQTLHAQSKPPVYIVTDISEITDPEGFKAVGGRSQTVAADRVQKLGGRYVARTQNITAVDGTPPKRFIMTAFDNAEKAQAYLKSDSQKEIDAIRTKTTKSRVFIVEGL